MSNKRLSLKFTLVLTLGLTLTLTANVFAVDKYRVSTQFFHLGELIGKPILELEEGETVAGSYTARGFGQYTIAIVLHPVGEHQLYVSMQFTSGNIDIQPNLLVDIGTPRSATIDKVRLNLLVEEIEEENFETPDLPLRSLTQNIR